MIPKWLVSHVTTGWMGKTDTIDHVGYGITGWYHSIMVNGFPKWLV